MSRPAALLALVVALIALGCPEVQPPPAPPPPQPVAWRMSKSGLGFRLGDADARDDRPAPRAKATPLSEADEKRVLDRLPPLPADSLEQQPFALRDRSQPPPRPGRTITDAFPPPPSLGAPPAQGRRPGHAPRSPRRGLHPPRPVRRDPLARLRRCSCTRPTSTSA